MGVVHTAGTDLETHVYRGRETYRKLVFSADGERLLGAVLIGDIANAGLYRSVIRDRKRVHGIKQQIVGHRLHYGHLLCNRGD
jgi:NAD(P)H-nitrite reductase large subunit